MFSSNPESIVPFLSRRSFGRNKIPEIGGFYSEELDMWAVKTEQGILPIITSSDKLYEITTKTEANQESDDEQVCTPLEITLKTLAQKPEHDHGDGGDGVTSFFLMEIATKTAAAPEGDDTRTSEIF